MCICIELKKCEYFWSIDVVLVVGLKKCDDFRSMVFVLVVGLLIIFVDFVYRLKSWKTVSSGNIV